MAAGYGRNTATALLGKIIISAIATIIIFLRCLGVFDTRDLNIIKKDRELEERKKW